MEQERIQQGVKRVVEIYGRTSTGGLDCVTKLIFSERAMRSVVIRDELLHYKIPMAERAWNMCSVWSKECVPGICKMSRMY